MMNPKKKADLQRKLTLAQVPKPPADLAERIKRDIPPHLVMGAPSERARFTRSIFFDVRVAASVLLLVTSAYFALQFFTRAEHEKLANLAVEAPRPAQRPEPATLTADTATAAEQPVEVARFEPQTRALRELPSIVNAPAHQNEEPPANASGYSTGIAGGAAAPAVATEPAPAAAPPQIAEMSPPPVAAAAPMALEPSAVMQNARTFAFDAVQEAKAADLALPKRAESVFGISTDHRAFERIKTAIEHGEQPESSNIDVAALVNYFAGPAKHESHDVRLEAEGSTAPVVSDPTRRIIRITIDTATADLAAGASLPPIATDASIDVEFDKAAVLAFNLVGGDGALHSTIEPTLLKNTSVTALYDISLAPRGASWQRVATFRLKYTSVVNGKTITIERTLRRRDLEKTWVGASRRHRLASLGALWGETLKGMAGATDVARRAEELALQSPEDAKARELADVANASSQLHGSASGSAR